MADKLNATTILKLLDALLSLKDVIETEIEKEADAKKRKKYRKAMGKALDDPTTSNILAFRELLFKV